ncbi:nicotinamidase [Moraxella sp. ZJ142]|uniref:nicotinamidase n=1 Tax=Moraxella marmotae TaxID=3344520 RepID=UPI0035D3E64B
MPVSIDSINQDSTALIVVDVQNGFIGGNLAVAGAKKIIPTINNLAAKFHHVILTQDYHPANHISFADNHHGKNPFEIIDLPYGKQVLWSSHCVQGTADADFHADLSIAHAELIIRKGYHPAVDSYSAFFEADGRRTGLAGYLNERGIDTVYVVGIALDYCVAWTAMDAIKAGFRCHVIQDATAAIDQNGSLAQAMAAMQTAGVILL